MNYEGIGNILMEATGKELMEENGNVFILSKWEGTRKEL